MGKGWRGKGRLRSLDAQSRPPIYRNIRLFRRLLDLEENFPQKEAECKPLIRYSVPAAVHTKKKKIFYLCILTDFLFYFSIFYSLLKLSYF